MRQLKSTRPDVILLLSLFFILIAIQAYVVSGHSSDLIVKIKTSEKIIRHPINKDKTFFLNGPEGVTVLKIENQKVYIEDAPCPLQTCKKTGIITRLNENIICIPNKIIISIVSKNSNEQNDKIDEITR